MAQELLPREMVDALETLKCLICTHLPKRIHLFPETFMLTVRMDYVDFDPETQAVFLKRGDMGTFMGAKIKWDQTLDPRVARFWDGATDTDHFIVFERKSVWDYLLDDDETV